MAGEQGGGQVEEDGREGGGRYIGLWIQEIKKYDGRDAALSRDRGLQKRRVTVL